MSENHGAVWWTEMRTRDLKGAQDFYGKTCGWSFETVQMPDGAGNYVMGMRGGKPVVGMMDMAVMPGMDDVPAHWFSYFAVDDVDATVADTKAGGGQVIQEPFDIAGTGRIAIVVDPTGAAVGLMTPADMPA